MAKPDAEVRQMPNLGTPNKDAALGISFGTLELARVRHSSALGGCAQPTDIDITDTCGIRNAS